MALNIPEVQKADIVQTIKDNPAIKQVHFTADGNHHFTVHEFEGKKYSRLHAKFVPKSGDGGMAEKVIFGKPEHQIVETQSASEILGTNTKKGK